MATEVPQHHKTIAKHVAAIWKSRPHVRIWSVEEGSAAKQAVASLENYPKDGITSYSTVGLSDQGGYEILSATRSKNESFAKALFDVASYVLDGKRTAEPGATFQKVVSRYYSRCHAGHLLLARVPLPHLKMDDLPIGSTSVSWLYAWPLTSDELIVLEKEGYEVFERSLKESTTIDAFDLDRKTLPGVPAVDPWK